MLNTPFPLECLVSQNNSIYMSHVTIYLSHQHILVCQYLQTRPWWTTMLKKPFIHDK